MSSFYVRKGPRKHCIMIIFFIDKKCNSIQLEFIKKVIIIIVKEQINMKE